MSKAFQLSQVVDSATNVPYLPPGTGAVATNVGAKLAQTVSVLDFAGVDPTGATDSWAGFNAALTAASGGALIVPTPSNFYKLNTGITVPANTAIFGSNKRTCQIRAGANVDLFTLMDGAQLHNLYLEGNATTGHGLLIPSAQGNQTVQNCRVINFAVGTGGGAVHFADNSAGSRIFFSDVEAWQTGGTTGTGKYAFYTPDVFQAAAVPKKFFGIETGGNCAFFFGGSNDNFISGSFLGDLNFTANSRSVAISNCRVANQAALTVLGSNHSLIGGDWAPQITAGSGLTNSVIGPFSENLPPIIDNTINGSVQIFEYHQTYTPTLASGGTAPVLGNGTLTGFYTRDGASITAVINFTVGSTTTLGTGGLQFGLPVSVLNSEIQEGGNFVGNHAGTIYTASGQIPGNVAYVTPVRDTTGSITFNSPATWATGDTMRMTVTYYR